MLSLGILISGSGSNLQSIIDAINIGNLNAKIAVVISNKKDAYGLTRASNHHIPTKFIDSRSKTRQEFDLEVLDTLTDNHVDLVVLAGFMRIITPVLITAYPNRIINIHPSLLPSFPGSHAQEDALKYGVKISGCTVHYVDEGVDTGKIIAQSPVVVYEEDTVETLKARILKAEHHLLPSVIQQLSTTLTNVYSNNQ
jgi:phosphoribosylglycinamide formyltransferase-1